HATEELGERDRGESSRAGPSVRRVLARAGELVEELDEAEPRLVRLDDEAQVPLDLRGQRVAKARERLERLLPVRVVREDVVADRVGEPRRERDPVLRLARLLLELAFAPFVLAPEDL